jgi:hypothetical protein
MRGHREPEHTRRGMQRGRACPRTPAAVDVLRSLRGSVDRQLVERRDKDRRTPCLPRWPTRRAAGHLIDVPARVSTPSSKRADPRLHRHPRPVMRGAGAPALGVHVLALRLREHRSSGKRYSRRAKVRSRRNRFVANSRHQWWPRARSVDFVPTSALVTTRGFDGRRSP